MIAALRRRLSGGFADLPWWAAGILGLGCLVLGVVLALRPFASLAALVVLLAAGCLLQGITHLLGGRGEAVFTRLVGVAWLLVGVGILALPGVTIGIATVGIAVALLASGVGRFVRLPKEEPSARPAGILLGAATVVLGVVALVWPDVTVLVVAAVLGVQLALFGVDRLQDAWRTRPGAPTVGDSPVRRHTARRTAFAALALLGAVALLLVSLRLSGTPRPDAFYDAPADVPAEPGQLLRSEPFTRDVLVGATGWRILYTTTLDDGVPAVASGLVVTPPTPGAVVAWAHGTTGQGTGCAPSLLEHPFEAGAFPGLDVTLAKGWAVVATDYPGLGTAGSHPYLMGQPAGRSVLDAVRAAQQLAEADLPRETVVWGHSQGGHAALWAGGLASTYAPDVDVEGVVAMAPAANLPDMLALLAESPLGGVLGSFVISAWADHYDDVSFTEHVRPGARIGVQEMAGRCLTDPSTIVSVVTSVLGDKPVWDGNPARGAVLERARENVPKLPVAAPLLVAQGGSDTLVTTQGQDAWVAARCEAGQQLDYRTYDGLDHMGLVTGESPLLTDLLDWTAARLAGEPPTPTC